MKCKRRNNRTSNRRDSGGQGDAPYNYCTTLLRFTQ
nr:MAG TPA: hypothetical protein [Caudoviricetes sp.]